YLIATYPFAAWVGGLWLARAIPARVWNGRAIKRIAFTIPVLALAFALFGPSPHKPTPDHWRELRDFVRSNPDAQLCTTPRSRTLGAQLYLMRDEWPHIARWAEDPDKDAPGVDPPVGTLMVARKKRAFSARPTDEIVFENAQFIVWRLTSDWDGRYSVRADSSTDDDSDE
ncbi:MAG: hypothetical protein KDA30_16010, partial [Phycisphaerales bacterium]|nr:hypothetical protein [Phycisphaerales bacterium]